MNHLLTLARAVSQWAIGHARKDPDRWTRGCTCVKTLKPWQPLADVPPRNPLIMFPHGPLSILWWQQLLQYASRYATEGWVLLNRDCVPLRHSSGALCHSQGCNLHGQKVAAEPLLPAAAATALQLVNVLPLLQRSHSQSPLPTEETAVCCYAPWVRNHGPCRC